MKQKQVLFVVAECQKFVQTGGLADVAGSLPKAVNGISRAYKVRVIMPLYRTIIKKYEKKLKFLGSTTVSLAWRHLYCGVYTMKLDKIDYYFIDNKYYFDRDEIYGHYDDGERFAFFSKSIFDSFSIIGFIPDIIHTHDWHSALVNIYLDILYKKNGRFAEIKSLFTIHNIQYQGIFDLSFSDDIIGIDSTYCEIIEYNGLINLIKGAIVCSDLVTTVSPRYAREITTAYYAHGLENITRIYNKKIVGITNGIDIEFYNPATDENLAVNYTDETIEHKQQNKAALQASFNLNPNLDIPLICIISRLVAHKGLDLVVDQFEEIMKEKVQIVILGKGDSYYQDKFQEFMRRYPGRVCTLIAFDINLSKKIYGSCDFLLMPSKAEPCGLSQMIASRYGTVPIVRAVGGLYDTVKPYNDGEGGGFVFKEYSGSEMTSTIKEAINLYNNKDKYQELMKKIMRTDFSWNVSAKSYLQLYKELIKNK
ncbi:MAG: glycogen/starch synthase [Bacilli bacterium]|nr:glycogen/starch synthase [Bacilli bacterium]